METLESARGVTRKRAGTEEGREGKEYARTNLSETRIEVRPENEFFIFFKCRGTRKRVGGGRLNSRLELRLDIEGGKTTRSKRGQGLKDTLLETVQKKKKSIMDEKEKRAQPSSPDREGDGRRSRGEAKCRVGRESAGRTS